MQRDTEVTASHVDPGASDSPPGSPEHKGGPQARTFGIDERIERAIRNLQAQVDTDRSFRVVYDNYFAGVRRFFERKRVSPAERPDLIQITFMRIYKGVGGLKSTTSFEAFLRTTAQRVFLKWLEKANSSRETLGGRTRVAPDDQELLDYLVSDEPWPIPLNKPPSPEYDLRQKDFEKRVTKAIEEMPPAMRRIAKLRFTRGLTNKEITQVLHKTSGDVGYQLHQARKRIATTLQADGDLSPGT